ncbi:TPA: hypothetical protein PXN96_004291 [Yersinia enterocolitica]|nr:hypothetical protein [Yersinia enterocolitica]
MLTPNNDFSEVIKELRKNAKISNLISITMTYIMVLILVCAVVGTIAFQKQDNSPSPIIQSIEKILNNDTSGNQVQNNNTSELEMKFAKESNKQRNDIQSFLAAVNSSVNKVNNLERINNDSFAVNGLSNSITKVVLTLTLAFFAIYSIKISILFIKYYSQLSSHYSSLAAAFIASNGDFDKAVKLVKVLSISHISMGKTPDTIHETALKNLTKAIAQITRKD